MFLLTPEKSSGMQYAVILQILKLKEQIENLPENTKSELLDYFISYRKDKTKEGIIVRDADLLENALEAKEYLDKGLKHAQNWIDNVEAALETESAKKILAEIKNNPDFINSWWQGLKKMTHQKLK